MRIRFKMTEQLLLEVRKDLLRPHPFAAERVGFLAGRVGSLVPSGLIVLAHSYHAVEDEDYLDHPGAGATINSAAMRKALQFAYQNNTAMFHVHMHTHVGLPSFSLIDETESAQFVPDFWHVQPQIPHGAIILSLDSAVGKCWCPRIREPKPIREFVFVGWRVRSVWNA
jgi:hypothetical protein